MPLLRMLRNPDLAIDLGTAVARVGASRMPSFVERPARVGCTAALRGGVVINAEIAAEVLRGLFRRFQRLGCRGSRALACAPSDASAAERNELERAVRLAGATEVFIAPEPLAAAIGAKIDVSARQASLVIDFGEGVTDCAVIAEGQIVASNAVRGGCCALRDAVIAAVERQADLRLDEDEAERLLRHVGLPRARRAGTNTVLVSAIASGNAVARKHALRAEIIARAIAQAADEALLATARFVRLLDPRRGAEVVESGVVLSGGGALVPGMAARLSALLELPIRVAPTPLESVIHGAREMLAVAPAARLWS
jgi:rod shape-determining protein MreB and related proteins